MGAMEDTCGGALLALGGSPAASDVEKAVGVSVASVAPGDTARTLVVLGSGSDGVLRRGVSIDMEEVVEWEREGERERGLEGGGVTEEIDDWRPAPVRGRDVLAFAGEKRTRYQHHSIYT